MRLLLTNDDGIHAPGLVALAHEALSIGEITIIAPLREQSAQSHSITLVDPLVIAHIAPGDISPSLPEETVVIAVGGTPADCVKLGLEELMEAPPDVVVAGVNLGANTGMDVFYSGTVASALEGVMHGIPSFAVSLGASECVDIGPYSALGMRILKRIFESGDCRGTLFNVNIPHLPVSTLRGVRVTRQDLRGVVDQFERRSDPTGRTYFWMRRNPTRIDIPAGSTEGVRALESDCDALLEGFISVTPIRFDLTDYDFAQRLKGLERLGTDFLVPLPSSEA